MSAEEGRQAVMDVRATGSARVPRGRLADIIGLGRSALANWERRYTDFPRPVRENGRERFDLEEVARWAAGRRVPAPSRRPGEPEGVTYADRIRAYRDAVRRVAEERPMAPTLAPGIPAPGDTVADGPSGTVDRLVEQADRQWQDGSVEAHLTLSTALLFLRLTDHQAWHDIVLLAETATGPDAVVRLLDLAGTRTDQALTRQNIVPSIRSRVRRLTPRTDTAPRVLVDLVGRLGASDFRELLDRYEARVGLDAHNAFTPRAVADLVGDLLAGNPADQVYDPYARGGELLTAVLRDRCGREGTREPAVTFGSPNSETRAFAAMHALVGGAGSAVAEPSRTARAPWGQTTRPNGADVVVANPPFNSSGPLPDRIAWPFAAPPAGSHNLAWAQYAITRLNQAGRAVIVMPDSAGRSASPHEAEIRHAMLDRGAIECVITLPARLFAATAVKVNLWILRRPVDEPTPVLFIDATGFAVKTSGKRFVLRPGARELIAGTYLTWRRAPDAKPVTSRDGLRWCALPPQDVVASGGSLNPPDHTGEAPPPATSPQETSEIAQVLAQRIMQARQADDVVRALRIGVLSSAPRLAEGNEAGPRLGELCAVQPGPSPAHLKGAITAGAERPLVLPKHLRDRRVADEVDTAVHAEVARKLPPHFFLARGDILCVRTGTVGPCALVGPHQEGWLLGTNLVRLHNFAEEIDPGYLLAHLSLPATQTWLKRQARQTTVPSITAQTLKDLRVPLPPLERQRAVAAALARVDDQIIAHRAAVRAASDLHQALSEQLLSGRMGVEPEPSNELLPIPYPDSPWQPTRLPTTTLRAPEGPCDE